MRLGCEQSTIRPELPTKLIIADHCLRYNPLHQQSFYDDVFTPLFDLNQDKPVTSHALSVAFIVLGLGALVDLNRAPYDPEADRFYQLSRAALSIDSCLENTTINAIQSLVSLDALSRTISANPEAPPCVDPDGIL